MALVKPAEKAPEKGRLSARIPQEVIDRLGRFCTYLNREREEVITLILTGAMDMDKAFRAAEGREKPARAKKGAAA